MLPNKSTSPKIAVGFFLVVGLCLLYVIFTIRNDDDDIVNIFSARNDDEDNVNEKDFLDKYLRVISLYKRLEFAEQKVFSQNGEDGIILEMIDTFGLPQRDGYYVEFGTQSGSETNTRFLRETRGWRGLLMDGSHTNLTINLHEETIRYDNIVSLFEKYEVPSEFDLFSEDTDYADYWIMQAVLEAKSPSYRPKMIIVEVNNGAQSRKKSVSVPKPGPGELLWWDKRTQFHGASVSAFWCQAQTHGYTMVYCDLRFVNCFWIRNDLLARAFELLGTKSSESIEAEFVQQILNPTLLTRKPEWEHKPFSPKQQKFVKVDACGFKPI